MKVVSPVGEFPYTLGRIRLARTHIVVDGQMGKWPARIEVSIGDITQAARQPIVVSVFGLFATLTITRAVRRAASARRRRLT
jgi:hypothetical protein